MASRFLCFGDSLTEGYTFAMDMHPYSRRLKELLFEQCKEPVEVDTEGVSGERVIDSMKNRLDTILSKQNYNWIIILGGTNDLGYGESADTLLPALLGMHDRARATGARTIALSIPQFALELMLDYESLKTRKAKVNKGLREYCEASEGQSIFVDLYNELPHATLSPEERRKYWCDGLHCTPQGYDRMAEIVFATLKKHLTT